MPTYVYACQGCGRRLERRQSFSDAPLVECEVCGGELRRVLQPAGIVFRGSGFYTTDYARGSSAREDGRSASGDGAGTSSESSGAKESVPNTTTSGGSTSSD